MAIFECTECGFEEDYDEGGDEIIACPECGGVMEFKEDSGDE